MIGLRTDGIKVVEQKLALAVSKQLSIVDLTQNCGAIGIAVAQLIPDSNVVILDEPDAMSTIEENIRVMLPALGSTVRFRDGTSDSIEEPGSTGRSVDMIFATASQINDDRSFKAVQTLGKMMKRSPRAVVVLVEEEDMPGTGKAHQVRKASPIADLLRERGHKLRGSEQHPGGSTVPQ